MRFRLTYHSTLLICLLFLGCASSEKTPNEIPKFSFKAKSLGDGREFPAAIYLFPPLKCNLKGEPVEKMSMSGSLPGGDAEWHASALAEQIRGKLTRDLEKRGYEVITFSDLLKVPQPHSVMVISCFYSDETEIKPPIPGRTDRTILSKILARSFDVNLDPKTSRLLSQVDAISYFYVSHPPSDLRYNSIRQLFDFIGDNSEGQGLFLAR